MEKKQGFFSTLKEEVVRGLSPSRTRPRSRSASPARSSSPFSLLFRKKNNYSTNSYNNYYYSGHTDPLIGRSGSLRPVLEGPDSDDGSERPKRLGSGLGQWVKGQLGSGSGTASFHSSNGNNSNSNSNSSSKRSDLRVLLGVMGAPLAPVQVCSSHHSFPFLLSIKDTPIETSSAQYILQQYMAASGGQKLQSSIRNAYAMGKLKMIALEFETPARLVKHRNGSRGADSGGFVLWQMNPDMWYVELAVAGSKVHAGCNGKLVWRHTPWLGAHTAKGPVRPLRRALQGLDPRTTASMFADARCIGERKINGEDCFILKLCADLETLKARSEGPAEIIRHVLFGYFSQRTGLLVRMEDSHLTRIQSIGGDAVYWETTINSCLDDYRPVEGIMIAHSGRSVVTLYRFGETAMSHTKTKMEEAWTIEEVAFNVPGLSVDCFIPPADLRSGSISEACELPHDERGKSIIAYTAHRAKVAALDKSPDSSVDNMVWKMEV